MYGVKLLNASSVYQVLKTGGGKKKGNVNWKPKWTTSTAVAASCQELLKCGCKKSISNCVGNSSHENHTVLSPKL